MFRISILNNKRRARPQSGKGLGVAILPLQASSHSPGTMAIPPAEVLKSRLQHWNLPLRQFGGKWQFTIQIPLLADSPRSNFWY